MCIRDRDGTCDWQTYCWGEAGFYMAHYATSEYKIPEENALVSDALWWGWRSNVSAGRRGHHWMSVGSLEWFISLSAVVAGSNRLCGGFLASKPCLLTETLGLLLTIISTNQWYVLHPQLLKSRKLEDMKSSSFDTASVLLPARPKRQIST